jgi:hypothetical protein
MSMTYWETIKTRDQWPPAHRQNRVRAGSAADQARGQRPGELPPVQCRGDAGVEERVSGCTAGGQARLR